MSHFDQQAQQAMKQIQTAHHDENSNLRQRIAELEAALNEMLDWFKPAEDDHGDTWQVWSRSLNTLHPPVPDSAKETTVNDCGLSDQGDKNG